MEEHSRGDRDHKQEKDEKQTNEKARDEKQEKDEKDRHEKDEKQEKDEKVRNDPLSAAAWAAVLIWVGVVLLGQNLLPSLAERQPWPAILIGAGIIFLLEALIRIMRPEYRRPIGGTVVFAIVLIAAGLSFGVNWEIVWPVALILMGVAIVAAWVFRRR